MTRKTKLLITAIAVAVVATGALAMTASRNGSRLISADFNSAPSRSSSSSNGSAETTPDGNAPWWCVKKCPEGTNMDYNKFYSEGVIECIKYGSSQSGTPGGAGSDGTGPNSPTTGESGAKPPVKNPGYAGFPGTPGWSGVNSKTNGDMTKPLGQQQNLINPKNFTITTKLPKLPQLPTPGSSGSSGRGGSSGSGVPTIVGNIPGQQPGTPGNNGQPGGSFVPPVKPGFTNIYGTCGCNQTTITSTTGKIYNCPVHYGEMIQIPENDGKTIFTIYKKTASECDPKWQCPTGYEPSPAIWKTCDPWSTEKDKKKQECAGEPVTVKPLDAATWEVCNAFESDFPDAQKMAADQAKKILCVSKKDCEKYAQMTAAGQITTASTGVDGKSIANLQASCAYLHDIPFTPEPPKVLIPPKK